jgi:hypothetical protein
LANNGASLLRGVANDFFNPADTNADWPQKRLKVHLWSQQQAIRESVRHNRYTAVPSAHDLGKSFIAAETACEWIDTHDLGKAFVVSTAPTSPQVTAILWREIERMHRKVGLPGMITMGRIPEWKIGKQLVGYGRKPSDYDESGFQGIHEEYLLVIVDEADGIPEQLWNAIDALATNLNARVLAIGNPNDPKSYFKTICMPGSGWNVIHLDGLLSPNFSEYEVKAASNHSAEEGLTGDLYGYMVENNIPFSEERVPFELQMNLLTPLWVAERMPRWGIFKLDDGTWTSSPLWEAKVRGRFSDYSVDGVIPMAWIMKAVERWKEWRGSGLPVEKLVGGRVYGVDVAGEGSDETCVSERVGYTCVSVERNGWGTDTMTPANRLIERVGRTGGRVVIDYNGIGIGTGDRLIEAGVEVLKFIAQGKSDATDSSGEYSFTNARSEAWWNMRELLDPANNLPVALPDDEFLISDLAAPKYTIRTGAKIHVEEKKETRKRLRRSPDTGDSVVMDFWLAGLGGFTAFNLSYDDAKASDYVQPYAHQQTSTGYVESKSVFDDILEGYTTGWMND